MDVWFWFSEEPREGEGRAVEGVASEKQNWVNGRGEKI